MNNTQRVQYLDLYRDKLHNELEQMQYGRNRQEQSVETVAPTNSWASAGTAAVAVMLVMGLAITWAF